MQYLMLVSYVYMFTYGYMYVYIGGDLLSTGVSMDTAEGLYTCIAAIITEQPQSCNYLLNSWV